MSATRASQIESIDRFVGVADSIIEVVSRGAALRALLKPDAPLLGAPTTDGRWHMAPLAVAVAHYGNRPSFGLWVMSRAVAALEYDLAREITEASAALVVRDVDNVLVAAHTLRAALRAPPSFGEMAPDGEWCPAPLSLGEVRYSVTPLFAVWAMLRAVVWLRVGWTGDAGPAVEQAGAEPDEAPGLSVEAPPAADVDADQQKRLV